MYKTITIIIFPLFNNTEVKQTAKLAAQRVKKARSCTCTPDNGHENHCKNKDTKDIKQAKVIVFITNVQLYTRNVYHDVFCEGLCFLWRVVYYKIAFFIN